MARGGAAAAGEAAADGGASGPAGARRHRAPFPPATQAAVDAACAVTKAMVRAAVPLDALRVAVSEAARAAAWSAAVPEQHVEQPAGAAKTTSAARRARRKVAKAKAGEQKDCVAGQCADGAADAAKAGDAVPAYVSLRFERLCRQHGAAWVDDSLRSSEMALLDGLGSPLSPDAGGGADTAAFSGDGEPAEFDEWGDSDGEEGMVDPDELTYDCAPPPAVAGCAPPPGAVCAASAEQGLRMMRWRASAPLRPALLLHRDPPALLTAGAAGMGAEEGCGKPVEVALLGLRAFGD
eukprot:gene3264-6615_t